MTVVLVGVHRAAEDQYRAVVGERTLEGAVPREAPFLELVSPFPNDVAEELGTPVAAMNDCQDVHHSHCTGGKPRGPRRSPASKRVVETSS